MKDTEEEERITKRLVWEMHKQMILEEEEEKRRKKEECRKGSIETWSQEMAKSRGQEAREDTSLPGKKNGRMMDH